jgi:predicted transcriptional regulator
MSISEKLTKLAEKLDELGQHDKAGVIENAAEMVTLPESQALVDAILEDGLTNREVVSMILAIGLGLG